MFQQLEDGVYFSCDQKAVKLYAKCRNITDFMASSREQGLKTEVFVPFTRRETKNHRAAYKSERKSSRGRGVPHGRPTHERSGLLAAIAARVPDDLAEIITKMLMKDVLGPIRNGAHLMQMRTRCLAEGEDAYYPGCNWCRHIDEQHPCDVEKERKKGPEKLDPVCWVQRHCRPHRNEYCLGLKK